MKEKTWNKKSLLEIESNNFLLKVTCTLKVYWWITQLWEQFLYLIPPWGEQPNEPWKGIKTVRLWKSKASHKEGALCSRASFWNSRLEQQPLAEGQIEEVAEAKGETGYRK